MSSNLGELIYSKTIPGHQGGSGEVRKGQTLRVVDVEGQQVCDFVAIKLGDPTEYQDCLYTNWSLSRYKWREGDIIRSNHMNPMWTIMDDKTAYHFTGGSMCSRDARRLLLDEDKHGCRDTIQEGYREHGFDPNLLQSSSCFNLFMSVDYLPNGDWTVGEPNTKPGDYIDLRAEMDVIWIASVCAWPEVNGPKLTPLRFELYDGPAR